MKVARLTITNFRGVREATLDFDGHTLMVGPNNVGKSTICEALELVLGFERLLRKPVVEEFDFYNASYLNDDATPRPIRIEVILTDLTSEVTRLCGNNTEHWNNDEKRLLQQGDLNKVDSKACQPCLRIFALAAYNPEEDDFEANTFYSHSPNEPDGEFTKVPKSVKRSIGFIYLRALRTGSRALSLERGSLLDVILRMKDIRTGLWEQTRKRLINLDPPIHNAATELGPVLEEIEQRLAEYISIESPVGSTKLFITQLTREHLRKTISFFLSLSSDQQPVPFQEVGTGTLNTLVLALLTFIAEIKKENVIFAMEEPEIAIPPYTQRRIARYLLEETTQCFVTSHSPFLIERFDPDQILLLSRDNSGVLSSKRVSLSSGLKAKAYRQHLRKMFAEAMLSKGVIVAEGVTEQLTLGAAAQIMEEADKTLFPLDLSGVVIVTSDGDGSLPEYGAFFRSLGLVTFAYYDRKKRTQSDCDKIAANFDLAFEIPHAGSEALLSNEVALDHQWAFLDDMRQKGVHPNVGIPNERPTQDEQIRQLTINMLKAGKGEGLAAMLVSRCASSELPASIAAFLRKVYHNFPLPKRKAAHSTTAASDPPSPSSQVNLDRGADGGNSPLEET